MAVDNSSKLARHLVRSADRAEKNLMQPADVNRILEEFHKCAMTPKSQEALRDFLRFHVNYLGDHQGKNRILLHTNLLVQCDYSHGAASFVRKLEEAMEGIGAQKKSLQITESELSGHIPEAFPENCSVLIVWDCGGEELPERRVNAQLWQELTDRAKNVPDCTIVAVGNEAFIRDVQQDELLRSRFFQNPVQLLPMTGYEIYQSLISRLDDADYWYTQDFREEIRQYIEETYYKAEKKDEEYVQELTDRILMRHYTIGGEFIGTECVPYYQKPRTVSDIKKELEQLVGLEQVKAAFQSLIQFPAAKAKKPFALAFSGCPGTGKTTVAKLTKELLYTKKRISRNQMVSVRLKELLTSDPDGSAARFREMIRDASGGVLFIEDAYCLIARGDGPDSPAKKYLALLKAAMISKTDRITVIFSGYEEELAQLIGRELMLSELTVHWFRFDSYTEDQLLEIFLQAIPEGTLTLDETLRQELRNRFAMAKTDVDFRYAKSAMELAERLKARQFLPSGKKHPVTAEDLAAVMPVPEATDLSDMIGLDHLKQRLKEFESRVKYSKYLKEKNLNISSPNMHMLFIGKSGTGKTAVAERIADCLFRIGVLATNKLTVVKRKDLLGSTSGSSAGRIDRVIADARNGVLFIDEVYSLFAQDHPSEQGSEVIHELVAAMDEYKDSMVVIFSGYPEAMRAFLDENPGVKSRIGYTFEFPNYHPDDLTYMFRRKLEQLGFHLDSAAVQAVREVMGYFFVSEHFDNGHFVNRLIDYTINNRSLREYTRKYCDITAQDIPSTEELESLMLNGWNPLDSEQGKSREQLERIAAHELGHAIVSCVQWPDRGILSVTIASDAVSSGNTFFGGTPGSTTERSLKARLAVKFGGRNAERVIYGDHSDGCVSDIARAKKLAAYMVEDMAVGDFGVTTAADLLREADQTAARVLEEHEQVLRELIGLLVEKRYLAGSIIKDKLMPQSRRR